MGIEVLPPDVNESDVLFRPAEGKIRFGLSAIKNVGAGAMRSIVKARKDKGRFRTIFDLCERLDTKALNKRALESLIFAGAMDGLEGHRAQHVAGLDHAVEIAQSAHADRIRGQISLFESAVAAPVARAFTNRNLPRVPEWTEREKLTREKEVLGLYLSGHPLSRHAEELRALGVLPVERVKEARDGSDVKVGGLLSEVKPHTAKNGKPMAFATLEDESGTIDLVVFPDTFDKVRNLIKPDSVVLVRGKAKLNGRTSILAEQVLTLDSAREKLASTVHVNLPSPSLMPTTLNEIKALCQQYVGSCSLLLHLEPQPDRKVVIKSRTLTVSPSPDLLTGISRIVGSDRAVWVSSEPTRLLREA
jgi:DNA polymerase-3 subunit alpha